MMKYMRLIISCLDIRTLWTDTEYDKWLDREIKLAEEITLITIARSQKVMDHSDKVVDKYIAQWEKKV